MSLKQKVKELTQEAREGKKIYDGVFGQANFFATRHFLVTVVFFIGCVTYKNALPYLHYVDECLPWKQNLLTAKAGLFIIIFLLMYFSGAIISICIRFFAALFFHRKRISRIEAAARHAGDTP